jgi:hypothetical protein
MSLGKRKLMVLLLLGLVFLASNILLVANWLADNGVVDWATHVRSEYLTGTAIAIIVVLLILLVGPRTATSKWVRRCPVCDHMLLSRGNYCSDCGSKVTS